MAWPLPFLFCLLLLFSSRREKVTAPLYHKFASNTLIFGSVFRNASLNPILLGSRQRVKVAVLNTGYVLGNDFLDRPLTLGFVFYWTLVL